VMARLRTHRAEPETADWLASGGWHIAEAGPQRLGRPDFERSNLDEVRTAVLSRLGATEAELRAACSAGTRTLQAGTNRTTLVIPPEALFHLSATQGDAIEFELLPDGRVAIGRAPEVDRSAVRARIRAAGISPGLLGRLFSVPESTVRRIVKQDAA
jgi:hypothetical protein